MRKIINHAAFSASILAAAMRRADTVEFYDAMMSDKTALSPEKMQLAKHTHDRMLDRDIKSMTHFSDADFISTELLATELAEQRREERRTRATVRKQMRAEREAIRDEYMFS